MTGKMPKETPGFMRCKSCNGTGQHLSRRDKRGQPLRCFKCKGDGLVARPGYRPHVGKPRMYNNDTSITIQQDGLYSIGNVMRNVKKGDTF